MSHQVPNVVEKKFQCYLHSENKQEQGYPRARDHNAPFFYANSSCNDWLRLKICPKVQDTFTKPEETFRIVLTT